MTTKNVTKIKTLSSPTMFSRSLPLTLYTVRLSNSTVVPVKDEYHQFLPQDEDVEFALSCPSTRYRLGGGAVYFYPIHLLDSEFKVEIKNLVSHLI